MIIVSTTVEDTKAKILAVYTDATNVTTVKVDVLPEPADQAGKRPELYKPGFVGIIL